jgi:hypothetical protein
MQFLKRKCEATVMLCVMRARACYNEIDWEARIVA